MSEETCRYTGCTWKGSTEQLFKHFKELHKNEIICITNTQSGVALSCHVKNPGTTTYLLYDTNGMYWYVVHISDKHKSHRLIEVYVLNIGKSANIKYSFKFPFQIISNGPYESEKETNGLMTYIPYRLLHDFQYLITFFGEYDNSYEYDQFEKELNANPKLKEDVLDKFTCMVCWEYIRSDFRICQHLHFICVNCFEIVLKSINPSCPTCRDKYSAACSQPHLSKLMKKINFPK